MVKIIDSLYDEAVKKLSAKGSIESVSRKLWSLKTNAEKTLYIYNTLKELELLPDVLIVSKTEGLSDKFRELGNKYFKEHNDFEALQYYNLSLLHAPKNSSQLCLAYANRSAVLQSIKNYEGCLKDIENVFSMDFPEKIKDKLLHRKKLCLKAMTVKMQESSIDLPLIPMPARNMQYPCASSKLKVCYSKEMGRHVIATENIDPGEILAIEEPYACYLLKPKVLLHCNHCFSFMANLIPCDNCCMTMYCSEECKKKAAKEYHSIECPIGATLVAMNFTKLELLALRIVVKARSDYSDWESLIKLVERVDQQLDSDKMGMTRVGNSLVYDSKYYESIHSLSTNIERRSASDVFQKGVTAAVLLHLVSKAGFCVEGTAAWECVAEMLLRHAMTSPTNMHNVSWQCYEADGTCLNSTEICSAAFGFLSLLNHSCAPNVVRFENLGSATATLMSLRRIEKGSQIFDNYGMVHALHTKAERQKTLKFQYKFDCSCEACQNDWPLFSMFRSGNIPRELTLLKDNLLNPKTFHLLETGCVKAARDSFRPLCDLAKRLEDYVPCQEINEVQEAMKQCGFIIFGVLPYGYSEPIEWQNVLMEHLKQSV